MARVAGLLRALLVVCALVSSCCTTRSVDVPPEFSVEESPLNPDHLIRCDVKVYVKTGPYMGQSGSGVIVYSSLEKGTFILTNAHVVLRKLNEFFSITPPVLEITLWNGMLLEAGVVAVISGSEFSEDTETVIDAALLWVPPLGRVYDSSMEDTQEWHPVIGEPIDIYSYSPEESPYKNQGVMCEILKYKYRFFSNLPVRHGNSGSGVYRDGKLVGLACLLDPDESELINGNCPPQSRHAVFTPLHSIKEGLDLKNLGWVLEE